jgi:hypothetical protein
MFRISAYLSTSTGTNKNVEWLAYVGWTDANGAKITDAGALQNKSAGLNFVVQDIGGQPLLYQTRLYGGGGGNGGMTYNLSIIVEQLQ